MSLRRLLSQPLTIQGVGVATVDDYGNAVPGPAGDPVPVMGFLEQKDTIETVLNRETVVSHWHAFLPATTVIHPMDYINFAAQAFQVDGEPEHLWNPRTRSVSHIECKLTVVT